MLAGSLLMSTVALQLAVGAGQSIRQHMYRQESLQVSHVSSHSTAAALWRFKSFSCTTRKNGVYPELASSCSYYYRCLDGAVFSYVCPPGQAFHYPSEECRPAEEVTCPHLPPASPPCLNQTDGYYPDYSQDCKSYYRCSNGTLSGRWQCGGDAVWDSSTGSCGTGPLLVCSPPSCWGLSDGPHPSPGSSCTSYFTCNGGVRTDHVCPYNSIFDYNLKRCVAGKSSVCYEQACEGRVNGLHAVPHAPCNSFFRCFNGALLKVEECPKHQIFDGRRCVSESNFSCWREGRGSCKGQEDGFHVSPDSDCRGFFLCHQQQFIRAFKCSPGLMFNGKECVDGRNYICNARSRLPDCSSKIDGYYTLEKSDCRTFVYCRGGSKMSEHTCPGNNVFNGEQCVDPVLFRCPVHQEAQHPKNFTNSVVRSRRSYDIHCNSRDNGFYLNETSKCKRFFHCRNGRRDSSGTCPPKQVFNGIRCVPMKKYSCPVTSDAGDHDCTQRRTGFYPDIESLCHKYYACKNGMKVQSFTCPKKHMFNGQVCVPSHMSSCPSSLEPAATKPVAHNPQTKVSRSSSSAVRENQKDTKTLGDMVSPYYMMGITSKVATKTCAHLPSGGYTEVLSHCTRFLQCGERPRWSECPSSLMFNPVNKACESSDVYTCPTSNPCQFITDGIYADQLSKCRIFFTCLSKKVHLISSCPKGQTFSQADGRCKPGQVLCGGNTAVLA